MHKSIKCIIAKTLSIMLVLTLTIGMNPGKVNAAEIKDIKSITVDIGNGYKMNQQGQIIPNQNQDEIVRVIVQLQEAPAI
jgi:hypothetical protein